MFMSCYVLLCHAMPCHAEPTLLISLSFSSSLTPYLSEPTGLGQGAMEKKIQDIAIGLFEQMKDNKISPICAGLALQSELIDVVLEASNQVRTMTQTWIESPQVEELRIHLDDFSGLLSRVLEEALEISNPLLASHSTQVHSSMYALEAMWNL